MYGSHSDTQLGSTEIFSVLVGFHQNCDQGLLLGIVTEVNNCYSRNIFASQTPNRSCTCKCCMELALSQRLSHQISWDTIWCMGNWSWEVIFWLILIKFQKFDLNICQWWLHFGGACNQFYGGHNTFEEKRLKSWVLILEFCNSYGITMVISPLQTLFAGIKKGCHQWLICKFY